MKKMISGEGKKKAKKKKYKKRRQTSSLKKMKQTKLHFPAEHVSFRKWDLRKISVWGIQIVCVCLLAFMLVFFFGQRVSNAGDSMRPALHNGDIVLVNRLVYNASKPKRGDVIAFKPNGNENAHYSIKRVVGLPGETVQNKDGAIYIDGKQIVEYIYKFEIETPGIAEDAVKLGEGEYFVMGDNHTSSDDSRMADVGNVKREDIYGKVWFVASFGKNFGWIKD